MTDKLKNRRVIGSQSELHLCGALFSLCYKSTCVQIKFVGDLSRAMHCLLYKPKMEQYKYNSNIHWDILKPFCCNSNKGNDNSSRFYGLPRGRNSVVMWKFTEPNFIFQ